MAEATAGSRLEELDEIAQSAETTVEGIIEAKVGAAIVAALLQLDESVHRLVTQVQMIELKIRPGGAG